MSDGDERSGAGPFVLLVLLLLAAVAISLLLFGREPGDRSSGAEPSAAGVAPTGSEQLAALEVPPPPRRPPPSTGASGKGSETRSDVARVEQGAELEDDGFDPATVKVRVVDARGQPVPGADVTVDNNPLGARWGVTGPDGQVTLEVPPAVYQVRVARKHAEGREDEGEAMVRAFRGRTSAIEVALDRTAWLVVRLDRDVTVWKVAVVAQDANPVPYPGLFPDDERVVVSDQSNGVFGEPKPTRRLEVTEPMRPGVYDLVVFGFDDGNASAEATLTLKEGQQECALSLSPQGSLTVRVEDPSGRGIPGKIRLRPLDPRHLRLDHASEFPFPAVGVELPPSLEDLCRNGFAEIGEDGRLSLPKGAVPPGRWRVEATPEDATFLRQEREVTVRSGQRAEVTLELEPSRSVLIRSTVQLADLSRFTAYGPPGLALEQVDATTLRLRGLGPHDRAFVLASNREAFSPDDTERVVGRADVAPGVNEAFLQVGKPALVNGVVVSHDPGGAAQIDIRYLAEFYGQPWVASLSLEDGESEVERTFQGESFLPEISSQGFDMWQTEPDGTFSGIELVPGEWTFQLPGGKPRRVKLSFGEERRLVFDLPRQD